MQRTVYRYSQKKTLGKEFVQIPKIDLRIASLLKEPKTTPHWKYYLVLSLKLSGRIAAASVVWFSFFVIALFVVLAFCLFGLLGGLGIIGLSGTTGSKHR